jgi:hypothetical protein
VTLFLRIFFAVGYYLDLCFVQEVQYWVAVILEQRADLSVCFSTEGEVDAAEADQPTGGARHHAA